MKKIMLYVVCLVLIAFFIPAIFTASNKNVVEAKSNIDNNVNTGENIVKEYPKYDYGQYTTIKLLHHETNTIEEIELDEYLYGVVAAEMPANFEMEALKSQAIVARTYTIYKLINSEKKHGEADICDDSNCCQAWISKENRLAKWEEDSREANWNKITTAVNETKGKIITYQKLPINAFFHSNSGGTTEAPINVWGGNRLSLFASCSNKWRRADIRNTVQK